jgi:serine O-acetyltransferase
MKRDRRFFTPEHLYESKKIWELREKILTSKSKIFNKIRLFKCFSIMKKCHCLIPLNENINKFTTPHGLFGIYISFGAKLGKDRVIFNNVTIGSNTLADSKGYGAPTIGNNVYIGAGAKIIGNVNVGDNVRIGANCVVTSDVPKDTTIVLSEPRLIKKKKNRDNKYYSWNERTKK